MESKNIGTLADLIKERRTIRLFKDEPVEREKIIELLNVAVWAPNHGNRQPWRFMLFMGDGRTAFAEAMVQTYSADDREKYGKLKYEYLANVPAHLVIVQLEDSRFKEREEDYAAVCCLIQNFQLAAWEQGLGVVWKTNNYNNNPKFRATFGVMPGEKIVGVLHVGYAKAVPPGIVRTPAEKLLTVFDTKILSK
ncbi:nitroreductase [Paenibacillus sp. LHD-38]|uniref:nitroreductase family protein n=1 Tax=Paenibacillus sp. LHD-38 TaxID=3072143 RepID=UPI00280FCD4E|nr:nitroreductase [Paenibacillus sp. LHD-38]MDQ8737684.1 nitroreductase [Paenibacillus sp. LHD-38]